MSYKIKIQVKTLKVFWEELKDCPDKKLEFYKWANDVLKCDQGIEDSEEKEEFENFFQVLFNK